MTRPTWPLPPHQSLMEELANYDYNSLDERTKRHEFIWSEFGPPVDMLVTGGIPAMFALHELMSSYIYGNFLACVLVAQVFAEHSLGSKFLAQGGESVVNQGFGKMIEVAGKREMISENITERLHDLRNMRNPYVHPRIGLHEKGYMWRLVQHNVDPEQLAQTDAEEAIRIIVDYLRAETKAAGHPWEPPVVLPPSEEEQPKQ